MGLENDPLRINLKCEPEKACELGEQYRNVLAEDLKLQHIYNWIEHSCQLVWNSLAKKMRGAC